LAALPRKEQQWLVRNRIPVDQVGLLSGEGGIGKTLLALQLAVAVVAEWPDWVGGVIERFGPVVIYSAEEDAHQIRRTIDAILASRGATWPDLKHRIHFVPGVDLDIPGLGIFNGGKIVPTETFKRLDQIVTEAAPVLVLVENAADVYVGPEIDRTGVTAFMRLIKRLRGPAGASVILLQQPSVAGIKEGSGRSGSTGWANTGRFFISLMWEKDADDNGDDTSADQLRRLKVYKSNRGQRGERVLLVWKDGVLVPASTMQSALEAAAIEQAFLDCLKVHTARGLTASPHQTSHSYAPTLFAAMSEARGCRKVALASAMTRLLDARKIIIKSKGPPSVVEFLSLDAG
jgi:RecA-family ATPase